MFDYGAGIGNTFSVGDSFLISESQLIEIANKFADSTIGLFAMIQTIVYRYSVVDAQTDEVVETQTEYKLTIGGQHTKMVYCDSTSGLIYYYDNVGDETYATYPSGFNKETGHIITAYALRRE